LQNSQAVALRFGNQTSGMIIAPHQQQLVGFLFIKENLFNRAIEKIAQGATSGMGQGIPQNQVIADLTQQQRMQQMQFLTQQQMNLQGQPQNMFLLQQQQQLMGMQGQQQGFMGMQGGGGQMPGQMQGGQMQQLTPQQRMAMMQQQQQQQRQGNQRMH
jgi:hypothetical protein